jgi:hypothetical protein
LCHEKNVKFKFIYMIKFSASNSGQLQKRHDHLNEF